MRSEGSSGGVSGSMKLLGQTEHPDVEAAVQRVLAACLRAGKPCGTVALDPDQANHRIGQGFRIVTVGIDVLMMIGASKSVLSKVVRNTVEA